MDLPTPDLSNYAAIRDKLEEQANRAQIVDDDDANRVTDLVKLITSHVKAFDTERTEFVRPLNNHVKAVNEAFKKALIEPLQKSKQGLLKQLNDYTAAKAELAKQEDEERREKLLEAAAEAEAAGNDTASEILLAGIDTDGRKAPAHRGEHTGAGAHQRTTYDFEIVDLADVPLGYLMIDQQAVRAYMKAVDNKTLMKQPIPGIRFTKKTTTVVR